MPKVGDTRKDRAEKLLAMVTRGPSFSKIRPPSLPPFSPDEASAEYRMWAESWVLEELRALVPELRKKSL